MPIRLRKLDDRRFCVTGTPTDAVMMAVAHVLKDHPPDLLLSGVNRGAKLGSDVTSSGTLPAAVDAALGGIRSRAVYHAYRQAGTVIEVALDPAGARCGRGLRT